WAFLRGKTESLVVVLLGKPFGGWLWDRTGRRGLMLGLRVATMLLVYPMLRIMMFGSVWAFTFGQMLLAVPVGMALGLHGAMVVELFPLRTRVTSMSVAYGLTLALAGGSAPLVSAWLIETFRHELAPAHYLLGLGAIRLAVI